MRSAILYEGNRGRRLNNLEQMNTNPQSGSTLVPWVPALDYVGSYKYISENGTYKTDDEPLDQSGDGIWAYTKINVNVAGGAAGAEDSTDDSEQMDQSEYDEEYDSADEPETIVVGQEVEPAGTIRQDNTPTTGSIAGKEPDTGDPYQVTAKTVVDKDTGEVRSVLEKKRLPKAIHIVRMPDKLTYADGDVIDYSGIEVALYLSYEESEAAGGGMSVSATPFKDARYPDGRIPFEELEFPTVLAGGSNNVIYSDNGIKYQRFESQSTSIRTTSAWNITMYPTALILGRVPSDWHGWNAGYEIELCFQRPDIPFYATVYGSDLYICVDPNDFSGYVGQAEIERHVTALGTMSYGLHGWTTDISSWNPSWKPFWNVGRLGGSPNVVTSTVEPRGNLNRDRHGEQQIEVNWTSPYDGNTYSTYFTIAINTS